MVFVTFAGANVCSGKLGLRHCGGAIVFNSVPAAYE